jgi:hypothetical protein
MISNIHTMLLSTTFLAKPMFRLNKSLFILEQTMDVTWQNIPWLVKKYFATSWNIMCVIKYFATSLNNIHVIDEYTKNIPWHGMKFTLKFLAHLSKFASSCLLACLLCCLSKYDCRWLSTHVHSQRLNMRVWFRIYIRPTLVNILEPILVRYQLLNLPAWSLNWVYLQKNHT